MSFLSHSLTALRAACLAAGLLTAPAVLAEEAPTSLTLPEARSFALGLLKQGQPRAARAIAIGLLRKDSRDILALMVLAEAERALGRPTKAKFAARRAWRSSDNEKERFAAAFAMSNILKDEAKFGQAQIWLRRAGQATDEPRFEHAARSEFRRMKAANPWSLSFGFTVAPTSNVNGGPNDNTYTIGDLVFVDPTAVPLSGLEIGARLNVTRRLAPADWGRVSFGISYDERRYILSSAAKAAVPTASGEDYGFAALEATLKFEFDGASEAALTTAELSLAQNWQANAEIAHSYKLFLGRQVQTKRFARVGYGVSFQDQTRTDRPLRSTKSYTVDGFALQQLQNKSLLRYGVALTKVDSASSDMAHKAATLSLSYLPAKPLFSAQATFSGLLQLRAYDKLRFGTSVRSDQKAALSANFVFNKVDYMGFSPSLTLNATRNISNKTFYDTQEFGLSLGIKSTF